MSEVVNRALRAEKAAALLSNTGTDVKNAALETMAMALNYGSSEIIHANRVDIEKARRCGKSAAFIERLTLDKGRISDMAEGLKMIKDLPDPTGETVSAWKRPNGLEVAQVRVPMGVIGIIYESRPNVTADATGLCIKTGNAVILRGGSEAINSNKAIASIMADAAYKTGIPEGSIQLVENTSRESVMEMMRLNGKIDLLIPRGGAGLISTVVENASVPVIETGVGNCHVYVDGQCDQQMALDIVVNSKTQRPSVCNAAESLLIDKKVAADFLPKVAASLRQHGVEIRGCEKCLEIDESIVPADDQDWGMEYLDYIISVKIVDGVDEAIAHINRYGTGHSESIVTNNYFHGQRFVQWVDAAAVYINASTRFTDGCEFGFGAEIGISTQKLHARGPMGLKELTTIKYVIRGCGQTR